MEADVNPPLQQRQVSEGVARSCCKTRPHARPPTRMNAISWRYTACHSMPWPSRSRSQPKVEIWRARCSEDRSLMYGRYASDSRLQGAEVGGGSMWCSERGRGGWQAGSRDRETLHKQSRGQPSV